MCVLAQTWTPFCKVIFANININIVVCLILSGADALLPHLPEMGQEPLYRHLPCLRQPLLFHTGAGSSHCRLLAREIQVSSPALCLTRQGP